MPDPQAQSTIPSPEQSLSAPARAFVGLTVLLGVCLMVTAGVQWPREDWLRFAFYASVAGLASGLKVRFPGVLATLSVNFFFNLLVAVELGFSEAVAAAAISGVVQSFWRPGQRVAAIQIPFNISVLALSSAAAALTFEASWSRQMSLELAPRIALAAGAQFLTNSLFVSMIIVLTERTRFHRTLGGMMWSLPYYFVGALFVGLFHGLSSYVGWQSALLTLPAAYLVFRSFQIYLDRLDAQQRHAQQMSELQRRTIEALALAIECKDETTHQHLSRVQVYALEIGKELGLSADEMEALRAASLLHDIGKLAVPESIINKPGRLTPQEYNKMKIHPGVGAEILSSVQFPYPVVPFVRSHHEKWDGTGYPDGIAGESIPIGARIIAVVDCLDALASDRQYRRAFPLEQAMALVRKDAGKAFDPKIVDIVERRYIEFEAKAKVQSALLPKLSLDMQVDRGGEPGAGFAAATGVRGSLVALASAVDERRAAVDNLVGLIERLKPQVGFEELMAVTAVGLGRLIRFDTLVAYRFTSTGSLEAAYSIGEDAPQLAGLRIPMGQGVSGWVAQNLQPIVNGNPAVEPGYGRGTGHMTTLRSALAAPMEQVGVVTLYSAQPDAFTDADATVLTAIAGTLAAEQAGAVR